MTKAGKDKPSKAKGQEKKPRVQKETLKDLDVKGSAGDVRGGYRPTQTATCTC